MLFGDHFKKIIKRRIKMNKFILSIMLSLAVTGYVHADTVSVGDSIAEGRGAKIKTKKIINKTDKDERVNNNKGNVVTYKYEG